MTGLPGERTHRIPVAEPFPWIPLVRSLAAHAVPGLESVQFDGAAATVTRLLQAPVGPSPESPAPQSAVLAEVRFGAPGSVAVRLAGGTPADDTAVLARLRTWLDLDAPAAAVDHFLSGFPLLAPLVGARPGLRIPGSVDPWETAVLTVLGQQVSLAAARTFGSRLVAEFGTREPGGFWLFPSPQRLAGASADELQAAVRITGSRARTIQALAEAAAGGLDLAGAGAGTRAELLALPGIGPWTVDYLAVRAAGDRDAFVPGDLVLRRALGVDSPREAEALAEPWRPWRAYALFHLWTAAAYDAPASRPSSGPSAKVRNP
ncbi:DNA-3-methyladenine glycosylase family protein [Arthrobacter koreensis]|uniref:DNA-3-methyladenine glycosylase family protein n=1 Tax=Arthrobacter koreensis TaxID=199136 RepID=UPI0037FFA601